MEFPRQEYWNELSFPPLTFHLNKSLYNFSCVLSLVVLDSAFACLGYSLPLLQL